MTRLSELLAVASEARLTVRELAMLEFLNGHPGASLREASPALKIPKPACTRALQRLVHEGLVAVEQSPGDRRLVQATPTKEGRRLIARLVEAAFS